MIRYIIQLRDGVSTFYAGSDRTLSNRWTSLPSNATRWKDESHATLFAGMLNSMYEGIITVRRIEVSDVPDYNGATY